MQKHFRQLSLFTVIALLGITTNAQQFFASSEYGLLLGGSHYFGDLNPNYGLKRPHPLAGVFFRYQFNPYISTKATLNATRVSYDDNLSKNAYQLQRNLNFTSNIVEASVSAELNFFWFSTGDPQHRFTPYFTAGIGAFYYDPYTKLNGEKYHLRELGTEGQETGIEEYKDRKYGPVSICFPVGFGIKYWIRPGLNLGVEVADRFTLTDYLDDVSTTYVGADKFPQNPMHPSAASVLQDRSPEVDGQHLGRAGKQRGDNSNNDHYLFTQITLSFQLKTYKCPSFLQGQWSL